MGERSKQAAEGTNIPIGYHRALRLFTAISLSSASPRRRQRAPVAPARLLGPHHLAYYRGYLQGLDLGRLATRYLTPDLDLRQARTTLAWIETELARGVKRLATRPRADGESAILTEKTWLAMIVPPAVESASARQTRQRKLLRALDALQPLLLLRPMPGDAVAGWFTPAVAGRLVEAGLATLGTLRAAVAADARTWYRHARGIGEATAREIEAWLRAHALAPHHAHVIDVGDVVDTPALAPLESLTHPAAQHDVHAIQAWLGEYGPEGSHTWRAYRAQAERLLLWTVFVRGKTLATLDADDCDAYRAFLADPQPAAQWVGRRGTPRSRHDWRPFEGPLAPSSIGHAVKILKTLCAWLARHGHLRVNPFASAAPAEVAAPRIQAGRSLNRAQWQLLRQYVGGLPADDPRTVRLQFMLRLVHATGLRVSEQAQSTVGQLSQADGWRLQVQGNRPRTNALPETVIDALRDHMEARGLGRDIERLPADIPLIGRVLREGDETPLSVAQVAAIWKRCFMRAGRALADTDPGAASHFAQASAHWLRHTAGAHALARGVGRKTVQRQLGHASASTTAAYADLDLH
ncbi:MAG: tyrosine-type recombinase/integrase [Cupriavidus sp.]|nr:tyrosine-type recombinase/integrase [Cupriavidus sp.]MCA3191892.1 tyrosine-type recombinase/integrase [Cupriavidus sp.]MCA3197637.1 tyrosine-type recombinase/integrase [Cupriavidus sp.]MCA3202689.1 tyrosine-type recombinase/integrase [Cupriavidus sp.]